MPNRQNRCMSTGIQDRTTEKNASIWFSKTCQMNNLTPKYMNVTINDNNNKNFNQSFEFQYSGVI
jgi:hypothetical protein